MLLEIILTPMIMVDMNKHVLRHTPTSNLARSEYNILIEAQPTHSTVTIKKILSPISYYN